MKKICEILAIIICIFVCWGVLFGFDGMEDDEYEVAEADGFEISAYNVILDVKENNKVYVTENITVNFTDFYKHGIYKFTPEWLEYTGKDGKTIKRKSIISDYIAVGDEYVVDTVSGKKRLRIGSANRYVGLGEKTYVIKYTYDMGKDPYKGLDELIFHAYGDYWGTEIKNASIQVNMPKAVDKTTINFFMDKYRKENANEFVDYFVDGKSVYAKFNQGKYIAYLNNTYCVDGEPCESILYMKKNLYKSLTIDIELPEGYFVGGSWNYGIGSFFVCLIVFVITICNFINWKRYGKDFPKVSETVEFYPPENLSSAEIGYIYGKQTNKKLVVSLIVQLASKGYIKIDEVKKDKKKEIQITNLCVKPRAMLPFDSKISSRVITIKRLKVEDMSLLDTNEMIMMKYLFKQGDEKELKNNIKSFLKVKDSLIKKGFIEIIFDNEESRLEDLKKRKDEYDANKKQYDIENTKYENKIKNMPSLTKLETMVYDKLLKGGEVFVLSEHKTFYQIFSKVEKELKNKLNHLVNDKVAIKKMHLSIGVCVLSLCLFCISYLVIEDMDPRFDFIYGMSFACFFINIIFTLIMRRKTKYGEAIVAKVNGFRRFLETTEKEQLESLVEKNPTYFYNILPYTYVLGISRKWVNKFENIHMPVVDMGTYDFNSLNSFHHLYNDVYYPRSTSRSTSRSSSGCSSCGGGCSSCGGGCSSCGGGGSW